MCGIIGFCGLEPDADWIQNSLSHLKHRGPDSTGIKLIAPNLTMGAVRLSMTDPLPRSNQPMESESKKSVVTFNGEIFNFRKLKDELISIGKYFTTDSDTEVLLTWLDEYGTDRINELNGMYSFAYFSEDSNKIILARDRLGKKPLYYLKDKDSRFVAWSSSVESLSSLIEKKQISNEPMADYFALGYILDPTTIYPDIQAVKPGEALEIDLSNNSMRKLPERRQTEFPENLNIRKVIADAVMERVQGHSNVGLSLSGGLDSSIIALILAENNVDAKCYSTIWADSDKDRYNLDAHQASGIAQKLGLNFKFVPMIDSSQVDAELRKYLVAMEEPNNNPSGVSMMRLYNEFSKDGLKVVLTGDGADEIFGGYDRYKKTQLLPNFLHLDSMLSKKLLLNPPSAINSMIPSFIETQMDPRSAESWLFWHQLFSESELSEIFTISMPQIRDKISSLSRFSGKESLTESVMRRDRDVWLPMESNRRLDRVSMFYSIEARSPFQDDFVSKFALKLNAKNKFRFSNKAILRDCFPEVEDLGVRKDKAGFISPVGHWLRNNPELIENSLRTLREEGLLRTSADLKIPSRLGSGDFKRLMQLWSLVVYGVWLDIAQKKSR